MMEHHQIILNDVLDEKYYRPTHEDQLSTGSVQAKIILDRRTIIFSTGSVQAKISSDIVYER